MKMCEITDCLESYTEALFINPCAIERVFTVPAYQGSIDGIVNEKPYTVISLRSGQQIKTSMALSTLVRKLSSDLE
jgi:hypothetical protein